MLHTNTLMFTNGPGTPNLSPPLQREAASSETVKPHTRKSQIIEEEDDDMEEEIEEVDTFSDPGVIDSGFTAEPACEPEEDGDETMVLAPVEEPETSKDNPVEMSPEPVVEPASSVPTQTLSLNEPEGLSTDEVIEPQHALETETKAEPEPASAPATADDVKTITTPEETEASNQHVESSQP